MKTTKKLIAIILCVAMLLSLAAVNAFAVEKGDKVEWEIERIYDDEVRTETLTYTYEGDLAEGENTVAHEIEADVVYEFDAEKAGFYLLSGMFDINVAERYENGRGYGNLRSYDGHLFYFSEGTKLVSVYKYSDRTELKVEYYGEISDVVLSERLKGNLICDRDLYTYEENGENYGAFMRGDVEFQFTTGKTYESGFLPTFRFLDKPVSGENRVELEFFKKELTLNIYKITDIIESMELKNFKKFEIHQYYDGFHSDPESFANPDTLTIRFTDGTSITKKYKYLFNYSIGAVHISFSLPDGSDCHIYSDVYCSGSDYMHFYAEACGHEFIKDTCPLVKVSFKENFEHYRSRMAEYIREQADHLKWCLEGIFTGRGGAIDYIIGLMDNSNYAKMVKETSAFLYFYIPID